MSTPFLGVENVNDFYGEHYLAAVLAGDLRATLAGWAARKGEERTPPQALRQLHTRYFRWGEELSATRQPAERAALALTFWRALLDTLGFTLSAKAVLWSDGALPLLAEVCRLDGTPLLWWVPALADRPDEADALSCTLSRALLSPELTPASGTVEDLITAAFDLEEPPRFVLVAGEREVVLAERARWSEQRFLRFNLDEILGRRDPDTLDVSACLLHRECLAPDGAAPLLDTLDDSSHKHAYGVSEDLKYALRECIELLGNAAAEQIAARAREQKKAIPWEELAEPLSLQCLRYMYRVLFLLYIEARPELGYAPMTSEVYLKGYSLERLRIVEEAELLTPEDHDGFYLHDSLSLLFKLVYDGARPEEALSYGQRSLYQTFELRPLRSHLFDPGRTPLLAGVRFPNHVLRDVIEKMSLSRAKKDGGRHRRRGRISYATLGIQQLGAVYEALLSFRGFFAREDLFEVKPAKGDHGPLDPAYFVPAAALGDYTDEEKVYELDERGARRLVRHPKGRFIYRMAGRDRQKSASYYTPTVLTRTVVKYALKELLEDEQGNTKLTAREVLQLRVLEPAVGSAAFLNEAVDQLAEAYLHRAQKERAERLGHERYAWEKQRVKMYLADNNVFGVDLNPVAIELAEISLWLNAIHGDEPDSGGSPHVFVPWFGMQLACGNSLVGGRRQAFTAEQLDAGPKADRSPWLTAVPPRVPLGAPRSEGAVWHFLLPDAGMATYGKGGEGAPIRALCKDDLAQIDAWRKEATAPLDEGDRLDLSTLSRAVDRLWDKHVELLREVRHRTTDPLSVYGRPHPDAARGPRTTAEKDEVWEQELASTGISASSPYRRLKLAMDYWCALWFWPIAEADRLPSRVEWLLEMALILQTDVVGAEPTRVEADAKGQILLPWPKTRPVEVSRQLDKEVGRVDIPSLIARYPRLKLVQSLADRYRFFHAELEFADVFADRGGFDLILGNPPWVKVEWDDTGVLGDIDPRFAIKAWSKEVVAQHRAGALAAEGARMAWAEAHEEAAGLQAALAAPSYFPALQGGATNLFKNFLPRAWELLRGEGSAGFVHPEAVYDEPHAKALRSALYSRLRRHFHFKNELGLFPEVHHQTDFSINIYGPPRQSPAFDHLANLFYPTTIDQSFAHDGAGDVPGIKDDENAWAIRGHAHRRLQVNLETLRLFADLFDEPGTAPEEARLPALHSRSLVPALSRFRDGATSLKQSGVSAHPSLHFNETYATRDRVITRSTSFPSHPGRLVLQGPHFFVGNPLYKCPRRVCTQSDQYDVIDLTAIPDDYLPRTNYVPACDEVTYRERTPKVPWGPEESAIPTTQFFRVTISAMIGPMGERTFQASLCPLGAAHVDAVNTYTLANLRDTVLLAATWSSLPIDFFVKVTGSDKARPSLAAQLPIIRNTPYDDALAVRTLALNCLTTWYADLWSGCFRPTFCADAWTRDDPRLPAGFFTTLGPTWQRDRALRQDFARRQALVEIDVLVAMALGLTVDQLCDLYRAQFPILRWYERDTWYDRSGRIAYTISRGLPGVGLPAKRKKKGEPGDFWEDVTDPATCARALAKTFDDDTLPGGPHRRTIVYQGPFDRCDREEDFRRAWAVFARRFG